MKKQSLAHIHVCLDGVKPVTENIHLIVDIVIHVSFEKSSIRHLNLKNDRYTEPNCLSIEFLNKHNNFDDKASDVRAILATVYKYKDISDEELKRIIICTGEMDPNEVDLFMDVHKKSIIDLIELASESKSMRKYLELK